MFPLSAQVLKSFLDFAEADVRSLISLYADVVSPVTVYLFSLFFQGVFLGWWKIACSEKSLMLFQVQLLLILSFFHFLFSYREEVPILCPNTLGRIQLGAPLNKVCCILQDRVCFNSYLVLRIILSLWFNSYWLCCP